MQLFIVLAKAKLNFDPMFLRNASRLMGVLPRKTLDSMDVLPALEAPAIYSEFLPDNYDVTRKWSDCKSVGTIRDQSNCGSCWVWYTFKNRLVVLQCSIRVKKYEYCKMYLCVRMFVLLFY